MGWGPKRKRKKVKSSVTRRGRENWYIPAPGPGFSFKLFGYTHLSTIGEEGGFFVIQFDGFCVKVDGSDIVARGEGLVALVLEINSILGHDGSLVVWQSAEGGGGGESVVDDANQSINRCRTEQIRRGEAGQSESRMSDTKKRKKVIKKINLGSTRPGEETFAGGDRNDCD